jgi:hypothetical protein
MGLTGSLAAGGLLAAVLWIAEIIRGVAYDRGRHVHLVAAIGSFAVAPALWFGGVWLTDLADRDLRPLVGIAAMALAGAAAMLGAVEAWRWAREPDLTSE